MKIVESFKVATTLSAYRIVGPTTSTANTVKYPAAATENMFGITIDTVLDTTSSIPVQIGGIAKLYFNDTVTSGNLVTADSNGRGVPFAAPNSTTSATLTSYVIGTLIGPSVAATGTIADVLINPYAIRASS